MTILDVNDQPPVFHPLPESCVVVTEFHEPGETVYSLKASDADDPNTPNGWVNFSILGGDVQGIYFSMIIIYQINQVVLWVYCESFFMTATQKDC